MSRKRNAWLYLLASLLVGAGRLQAGGLSAWTEQTPYGHELYHDGTAAGWVILRLDTTGLSLKRFYFYKGYTVAQADSSFLIINEQAATVQHFTNRGSWAAALRAQHLVPFLQRDYDANYSSAFGAGSAWLLVLLPVPLLLPLLWLGCLASLLFSTRRWLGFRRMVAWLYPLLLGLAAAADAFPQSL